MLDPDGAEVYERPDCSAAPFASKQIRLMARLRCTPGQGLSGQTRRSHMRKLGILTVFLVLVAGICPAWGVDPTYEQGKTILDEIRATRFTSSN